MGYTGTISCMGSVRASETVARGLRGGMVALVALALGACGSLRENSAFDPKLGVSTSTRVVEAGKPVPKGGGVYKVGKPYRIAGKWFYPREDTSYDEVGVASWYGEAFHGRQTANGEVFDMNALSAAHPTLPLPTYARVTNLENGKSIVVRVNDRGPYAHDRLIDLSARTAKVLGFAHQGTAKVRVQYVGRADHGRQRQLAHHHLCRGRAQDAAARYDDRGQRQRASQQPASPGGDHHLLDHAGAEPRRAVGHFRVRAVLGADRQSGGRGLCRHRCRAQRAHRGFERFPGHDRR